MQILSCETVYVTVSQHAHIPLYFYIRQNYNCTLPSLLLLQLPVSCSPLIKRLLAREKTAGYLFRDLLVKGQCGLK